MGGRVQSVKYLIPVLCAVALFAGCAKEVGFDDLEERYGLYFFKGFPFTGVVVEYKYSTGQKKVESTWKDGKQHGLQTSWYQNGQKKKEITYKDDKAHGLTTSWYENGQKEEEATYKDGKLHGLMTYWYENGQKEAETTLKDGKSISYKAWDEDGNPK